MMYVLDAASFLVRSPAASLIKTNKSLKQKNNIYVVLALLANTIPVFIITIITMAIVNYRLSFFHLVHYLSARKSLKTFHWQVINKPLISAANASGLFDS